MGFRKIDYNILFASTLDHFASTYYLFLAPILAPLFFPDHDEFLQLILYFFHIGISFIIKPLAVVIFSKIVEKYGVEVSLILSLFGINLCNLITAIIPEYSKIGIISSLSLIFLRLSSTLFSSAESFISKLYILESKEGKSELRASYYYPFFASAGAILASLAATIYTGNFRIYFLVSSIIGFGLVIHRIRDLRGFRTKSVEDLSLKNIFKNFSVVIRIIILTGVSYITWYVPFIYMNSVVPIITEIKEAEFAASSTIILILDLALIPLIGNFLENKNYKFFMKLASIMLSLSFIIFIPNIAKMSLFEINLFRVWIVFWGVVFFCPHHLYFKELLKFTDLSKYFSFGIGVVLGSSLVGKTLPLIGIMLRTNDYDLTIFALLISAPVIASYKLIK